MNAIKNIMFSSTRQWNCGDEFILFGVMNIFDRLLGKDSYNPILYNRNLAEGGVFKIKRM